MCSMNCGCNQPAACGAVTDNMFTVSATTDALTGNPFRIVEITVDYVSGYVVAITQYPATILLALDGVTYPMTLTGAGTYTVALPSLLPVFQPDKSATDAVVILDNPFTVELVTGQFCTGLRSLPVTIVNHVLPDVGNPWKTELIADGIQQNYSFPELVGVNPANVWVSLSHSMLSQGTAVDEYEVDVVTGAIQFNYLPNNGETIIICRIQ